VTIQSGWIVIALAILSLSLFTRSASGQASAGMTGTITDPSGAVVPNANVTVTNEATSVSEKTVTSSAGTYSFKGLPPGRYDITVEAPGFKKGVRSNVLVEVSTTPTIDMVLATGATTETVQVTADQVSLNTTQPEMGSTIEPVVVKAMPMEVSGRGRQVDALQFLAPGTTGNTFSHRVSGGVDFEQEIVYNGIPAPQPETEGYTTNFNPPFELVQEYRVERSTFSAQYGLGQGALTYQTASGTNNYHGDTFWINRNNFFDSVGFFNGPSFGGVNTPPTDHENNYGFTVGGPIWIPKVYNGRNKTFGHLSMEWYKQNNLDTDVSTVPTAQEKTGDFSDFVNGSTGELIPIYVPQGVTCAGLTPGQQFPGNIIPRSCISATSATYIPSIPDPDRPGSGIGGLDSNKSYTPFINPHIQHNWGFTIDHNLTSSQSLHWAMWRNTFSNWSFDNSPLVIAPNPLNSMKYEPAKGTVFLLSYANTLSPHLVMTAGAGWIGEINNQFNETKYNFPAISQSVIPPYIVWDGQHSLTKWGTQGSWLQSINRKLGIALENNWLWSKGRNTFNIGIDFRRSYQDDNEDQTEGGQFSFSQRTTSVPNTSDPNFGKYGSAFASFLLGIPDQANRANNIEARLRNWVLAPYIQDDIKLSPRLTVNLGLRWDIQAPFTENNNNIVFFDPAKPGMFPGTNLAGSATKFGNCTGCAGYDRASIHFTHFGPRLGFAYQLSRKTVVQGGFSIAFLNGGAYEYGTSKVAVNYNKLLVGSFTKNSTNGLSSSFGSWDTNIMPNPTATPFNPGLGAGTQINAMSKSYGYAPYSQQWNVNLQRDLGWNTLITAAYVANRVIHLPSKNNQIGQMDPKYDAQYGDVIDPVTNQSVLADSFSTGDAQRMGFSLPYPNFVNDFGGSATVAQALGPYPQYSYIFNNFEGFGTTQYESAQVQVEKRFTDGLSFLVGYTLSRLWDNTNSGFSSFTTGGINKYNQKPEWVVSDQDEPNTLKVSGTYELPIGPGKKYVNNHTLGNLVGGWQVGWILDYESGTATGPGENGSPFPNGFNRPDRTTGSLGTASYSKVRDQFVGKNGNAQIFPQSGFALTPTQYVIGNAMRHYSALREPAYYIENLNAKKHFYAGERVQFSLSVDYFNAFNRTRFQGPDTNFSNGTYGQVTSQGSQISNRQGQVSLLVEF
jgi:Carboxypeptidase regulatory-like domain